MRTAIFVDELSDVTIRTTSSDDANALLSRYRRTNVRAVGKHQLPRGVYLIASNHPLEVTVSHGEVVTMGSNKDEWPDPKPNVVALEPGATARSLSQFLTIAKDLSLDG